MKKKISPIKLHNLSEAEMETRELNLLRGGSGFDTKCPCVSACVGSNCTCSSGGMTSVMKQAGAQSIDQKESMFAIAGAKLKNVGSF